jgi:uncharacterized protein YutE (UPF0331/DUF86 family)
LPVDPVVVRRRLRALERHLRILRELRELGRDAFVHDEVVQDRVERNAQLLLQICADIALHLVAASGRASPESYADALRGLGALLAFPPPTIERLALAAGLRNVLVHMYLDVDHGRLFDELAWIDDAEVLAVEVERWLRDLEAAGERR